MTVERMWVSTEHTVEELIAARKAGVDLGTPITPGPGIVLVLATDYTVQSTFADALRGAVTGFPSDPDDAYRVYGRAAPFSIRAEGRGTCPRLVLNLGAHLHREAIRARLDAIRASGHQTFITTMNPAVVDAVVPGFSAEWQRGFIFVTVTGASHMTAEEARSCAHTLAVEDRMSASAVLTEWGLW